MDIGRLGCWTFLDMMSASDAVDFARKLEKWGYGALWIPEAVGRDPFALLSFLAAKTDKLVLATGIANIYARDAMSLRALQQTMAELSGGRFVLGLGVSHKPMVADLRGHDYAKPLSTMRRVLEAMRQAIYVGPAPAREAPIVIGALRPKMLALSAELAQGAHPYNVPPEHTARAREILGDGPMLCPDQKAILVKDASRARALGRQHLGTYLGLPNYRNNWRSLGFDDADFENGGSDRLIDAVFAWGDETAIAKRVQDHYDAGATHVCLQAIRSDGEMGPDLALLETFAPAKN
jgi:probable F420-dependent oxidoreductase